MPRHWHMISRPARGIVSRSRFSTLSSAAPPQATDATQQTRQSVHLPRTIASLLHPAQGGQPDAEHVTIHGWIKSIRRMGRISFAHIIDGTTSFPLQAILSKSQAAGLSTGSSVRIAGTWKASLAGTAQQSELLAEDVSLLGEADPTTYPLQKKFQSYEYLRTLPHLRPKIPFNTAVLRLRSYISQNLTSFFAKNEFVQCYPPIITSSDCEGAGEVFTVSSNEKDSKGHFFKSPKYLTVSTQLHLEALAAAVPRVWTLSPTFRAEKSDTHRHLSEFYMLEAELSFVETLDPLLDLIEDMIRQLVSGLASSRVGNEILSLSGDLKPQLEARWEGLMQPGRWKRLAYSSAVEDLQAAVDKGEKFQFLPEWGANLQSEHEKYLAGLYNGPVFVTDYPREIKPFYMLPTPGDDRTVACFDLLFPAVGELIGGSLREHRYEELIRSMKSHGLILAGDDSEHAGLSWYTDLRKWGTAPHGGFGMGLDRLLCYLTGVENIREVVAFPRWVGRCDA
ncbi:hypothetical protein FN846DRAFT_77850 [Sphaerosporella brunnea]|uniref:asparagine--tRNA ligase n=1 Tax=Sphaerosporella brunnea TaxID=1250544 RepID=A0A5J5F9H9_9PEZI|nr:hypothetical protein FN846DRAFT_77850 [Sphaerosporella brunnea]